MSWKIVDEILTNSKTKGSAKLLLLILGTHTHDDGTGAYPSLKTLQRLSGLSVNQVCLILHELENGHITITHGAGPHGTNLYTVLRPWAERTPKIGTPTRAPKIGVKPGSRREKELTPIIGVLKEELLQQESPPQQHPGYHKGKQQFVTPGSVVDQMLHEQEQQEVTKEEKGSKVVPIRRKKPRRSHGFSI